MRIFNIVTPYNTESPFPHRDLLHIPYNYRIEEFLTAIDPISPHTLSLNFKALIDVENNWESVGTQRYLERISLKDATHRAWGCPSVAHAHKFIHAQSGGFHFSTSNDVPIKVIRALSIKIQVPLKLINLDSNNSLDGEPEGFWGISYFDPIRKREYNGEWERGYVPKMFTQDLNRSIRLFYENDCTVGDITPEQFANLQ